MQHPESTPRVQLNQMNLFEQRDFGDKINATFNYVGQQFRSLGPALLYIVGPVAIVAGIASGIYQSNFLEMRQSGNQSPFDALTKLFGPAYFLLMVFSMLANLLVGLTTYSHMKLYHQTSGGSASVAEVWAEVQRHIGKALLFLLGSTFVIIVGTILFVIPGIYVAIVLSLGMAVIVFEDADFMTTWNRCFQLIREKWWSTFGVIVVMAIVVSIINLVFSIPAIIVQSLTSMKVAPDMPSFVVILTNALSTIGATLLYSLLYLGLGFQYTNLVERQEGTGLASAIDSIGTSPAKPSAQDEGDF